MVDKHDLKARKKRELKGRVTIIEHRPEGDVVAFEGYNTILDAGIEYFMDRAIDNSTPVMSHLAIGDSAAATVATQLALFNEVFRTNLTSTSAGDDTLTAEAFVSKTEALFNWKELGLTNDATSGVLINRLLLDYTHGAVDVTVRVEITGEDDGA